MRTLPTRMHLSVALRSSLAMTWQDKRRLKKHQSAKALATGIWEYVAILRIHPYLLPMISRACIRRYDFSEHIDSPYLPHSTSQGPNGTSLTSNVSLPSCLARVTFSYYERPAVSSFSPRSGPIDGATLVTVLTDCSVESLP